MCGFVVLKRTIQSQRENSNCDTNLQSVLKTFFPLLRSAEHILCPERCLAPAKRLPVPCGMRVTFVFIVNLTKRSIGGIYDAQINISLDIGKQIYYLTCVISNDIREIFKMSLKFIEK